MHVSVRVSLPHQRVLLLYKWPDSHPRGNAGRTTAGWRGRVGVAYCMHVRRSLSAEQLVGAGPLACWCMWSHAQEAYARKAVG